MSRFERDGNSTSSEPDTKRRKLRKGTKSCWDCKKRKVKCTFDSQSETICIACRRRDAPCVGQDQPEEEFHSHVDSNRDQVLERLQRVEGLLEQLLEVGHRVERDVVRDGTALSAHRKLGYFTPTSERPNHDSLEAPSKPSPMLRQPTVTMNDECRKISRELVKAFPSQEDIDVFCKSDYIATFYCHQIVTKDLNDRPENEVIDFVNDIARVPDSQTTPPVLIAKRMIIFALFVQYFQTQHTRGLTERPSTIMDRLVETAVRCVTSNEHIVGCVEGLECVVLEAVFQSNMGNMRRAWIASRKAMVIAQLMKIDCTNPPPMKAIDPNTKINPKFMWFRIVYMDSYLSLMLGLPHGGQETHMEDDITGETPSCKLERTHTLVARRIIDRNRRDTFQDFTTTRQLDQELLKAAKALPDRFWLPPNFTTVAPNSQEAFWEIMRLCDQIHHYNLVHLLHLPYLLRCDKEASYHTYAKITCINASREIISRFIAFRNFQHATIGTFCRAADFFSFMAGMTILLAHIDSHRHEVEDWRAHQRLGDRAMIEQLVENFEKMAQQMNDGFFGKCVHHLQALLQIEHDCVHGIGRSAHDTLSCLEEHCDGIQLTIPYFGIIKIGRDGVTKDEPAVSTQLQSGFNHVPDSIHAANYFVPAAAFDDAAHQNIQARTVLPLQDTQSMQPLQIAEGDIVAHGQIQQELQYPGLAASLDVWAFQGVDAAFFDSIVRGSVDWNPALDNL
ncbi:hypothetical protein EK21DRAFT_77257 [Setomelanomma holmii]|uniref:Zn(2)-C6 fungal-type domain-containing protein n=1 Tax=Setomelanomma holmii TaxID=210430 RepID=A0A9P4H1N8_9PLEO|nr:hypothetical protein EK21DRAFT_77257 [Setomelanomma holmii]